MDRKQYMKEYYQRTREEQRAKRRAHYQANKETYKKKAREWEEQNPERSRELQNEWRRSEKGLEQSRDWVEENREKHNETNRRSKQKHKGRVRAEVRRRQAAKLQRTPPWLTPEDHAAIQAVYDEAHRLEQADGVKRNVDHVVPLQGEEVSGLHVPWNLQILTEAENCSKRNRLRAESLT